MEWFFGDDRDVSSKHAEPRTKEQTQQAKKVCATCNFQPECLIWSYQQDFEWGVFGTKTEHERKRFKEKLDDIFSKYEWSDEEESQEAQR